MIGSNPGESKEAREMTSLEAAGKFRPNDEFLISTSEFVEAAIPIVYVKSKGSYLLFRSPSVSTTLMPEMPLWFKVTVFSLKAEITFKGEIYKLFNSGETAYPCLIVKLPPKVSLTPVEMADGVANIEIPLIWRKTGSMKKGTLKRLTTKGGVFETNEENVSTRDQLKLQLTLGETTSDELKVKIERIVPNEESGNFISNSIEFKFLELSQSQLSKIQSGINEVKSSMS